MKQITVTGALVNVRKSGNLGNPKNILGTVVNGTTTDVLEVVERTGNVWYMVNPSKLPLTPTTNVEVGYILAELCSLVDLPDAPEAPAEEEAVDENVEAAV